MTNELNVFSSSIKRGDKPLKNNLYELFKNEVASPISNNSNSKHDNVLFQPKSDKQYQQKRKLRTGNVRTVGSIRSDYEKEMYDNLPQEIANIESVLLKQIRKGSSKANDTAKLVKTLLKNDIPLSRATWQMLSNLNINRHHHPTQFIWWQANTIRINGSKGGEKKFLFNFDLDNKKRKARQSAKSSNNTKSKSLLKTSLITSFKPGPLSRKKYLDNSFQKFHTGPTELVPLPKISLEVEPRIGVALEPTISNILYTLREEKGILTEKWARFAVSTFTSKKNCSNFNDVCVDVTEFELNYQNNQNNILMRNSNDINKFSTTIEVQPPKENLRLELDSVINDLLCAVEISVHQDEMFTEYDEPRGFDENFTNTSKDRPKKKYIELERLDITVINISEGSNSSISCANKYCSFGCVCDSLNSSIQIKTHCGKVDCMFECTCDFSNYKVFNNFDISCPEYIPSLLSIEDRINSKLAKEEKKFHQTVVLTEEASLFLKSQRRNLKAPKRYEEFMSRISRKNDKSVKSFALSVLKLDCNNIEPWCMVHDLYRCFCKNRFIKNTCLATNNEKFVVEKENAKLEQPNPMISSDSKLNTSQKCMHLKRKKSNTEDECKKPTNTIHDDESCQCARAQPYKIRRFSTVHYRKINERIRSLEAKDDNLRKKLSKYTNQNIDSSETVDLTEIIEGESCPVPGIRNDNELYKKYDTPPRSLNETFPELPLTELNDIFNEKHALCSETSTLTKNVATGSDVTPDSITQNPTQFSRRTKLVTWLETYYKYYKDRLESGQPIILGPPAAGKIVLFPWETILDRYKAGKNYFFVTKNEPYRLFVGVHMNEPFFSNCISIDKIKYEDFTKYPITVRNLLWNIDDMQDNFYILCGLPKCWELIGSVTKSQDKNRKDVFEAATPLINLEKSYSAQNTFPTPQEVSPTTQDKLIDPDGNIETISKWFIMILENDISEVRFQSKGFFTTYDTIVKSINYARVSGRTVRLSGKKNSGNNDSPQFGMYAIPDMNEYCVFIGPYEMGEQLGIETIKIKGMAHKHFIKKTRGVWICTLQENNMNIIDDPLSLRSEIYRAVQNVTLNLKDGSQIIAEEKPNFISYSNNNVVKVTKINLPTAGKTNSIKVTTAKPHSSSTIFTNTKTLKEDQPPNSLLKPFKEMFILKPEQINQKLSEKTLRGVDIICDEKKANEAVDINSDIEKFLATSEVCTGPVINDVVEISDDESNSVSKIRDVWIKCSNIQSLGWIKGRINDEQELSFEFPGFKFTDFYPIKEAFSKITQVLSRKVYVPRQIVIKWEIVETDSDHEVTLLKCKDLGPEFVLTKSGLRHKQVVVKLNNSMALKKMSKPGVSRTSEDSADGALEDNEACNQSANKKEDKEIVESKDENASEESISSELSRSSPIR